MKQAGKNNLMYLMAVIIVIIAFIAFATYGMLDDNKDEEWYPVSVIVEDSSSDRYTSFRDGVKGFSNGEFSQSRRRIPDHPQGA